MYSMLNFYDGSKFGLLPGSAKPGYLICVGGQSNGTDRFTIAGTLPVAEQGVQANSYTDYKSDQSTDNGKWSNINSGVNTTTGGGVTGMFSLSTVIAYRLYNTYGKYGCVVPVAVGGTGIANHFSPGWNASHTNEYYDRLIINFNKANVRSSGNLLTPLVLWVHGESDAALQADADAYETNLTNFINGVRTETGISDLRFIITQLRSDTIYTYRNTVRTAQANVAANMTNVTLFDTSAYPISGDGEHYAPSSAYAMGQALADLITTF